MITRHSGVRTCDEMGERERHGVRGTRRLMSHSMHGMQRGWRRRVAAEDGNTLFFACTLGLVLTVRRCDDRVYATSYAVGICEFPTQLLRKVTEITQYGWRLGKRESRCRRLRLR
jgi:hypothetical protein